jgi:DNA-binding NtrC family response regulator
MPAPAAEGGEGPVLEEGFRAAKQRVVERFERDYIGRCLRKTSGNISQAARLAQIDYKNFYIKMQQYGIDAATFR